MHTFTRISDLQWENEGRSRATGTVEIVGYEADGPMRYTFDVADPVIAVVRARAEGDQEDREFTAAELFVAFASGQFGAVAAYAPPPPPPPPPPIEITSLVFFGRTTDEEAETIDEAMMARPLRIRSAWAAVTNRGEPIREGTILWDPLRGVIVGLYGEARADELLARPAPSFAATSSDEAVAA